MSYNALRYRKKDDNTNDQIEQIYFSIVFLDCSLLKLNNTKELLKHWLKIQYNKKWMIEQMRSDDDKKKNKMPTIPSI